VIVAASQLAYSNPTLLSSTHVSFASIYAREGKVLSAESLMPNSARPVFLHHLYRSSRLEFENLA